MSLLSKNEVYVDIIEKVDALISPSGAVLHADIVGKLRVYCSIKRGSQCNLILNNVPLQDTTYHPCVDLKQLINNYPTLLFNPPNQQAFHLMRYRVTNKINNIPFNASAIYMRDLDKNQLHIEVTISSNITDKKLAPTVLVSVPIPDNPYSKVSASYGKAEFASAKGEIEWSLPSVTGKVSHNLTIDLHLPKDNRYTNWVRPPLRVEWEPLACNLSGFRVKSFHNLGSKETSNVWIRYLCMVGNYLHEV